MMLTTLGLGLHFVLELCALAAVANWGLRAGDSVLAKAILGVGIPLLAAAAWGILRVPNDPGPAPIAVPGILRLAIEWVIMGFAIWALFNTGLATLGWIMLVAVVIDYAVMAPRVVWLIKGGI